MADSRLTRWLLFYLAMLLAGAAVVVAAVNDLDKLPQKH